MSAQGLRRRGPAILALSLGAFALMLSPMPAAENTDPSPPSSASSSGQQTQESQAMPQLAEATRPAMPPLDARALKDVQTATFAVG